MIHSAPPSGPPGPFGRPGLVIRGYAQRERAKRAERRLSDAVHIVRTIPAATSGARILSEKAAAAIELTRRDFARAIKASAGWFERDTAGRVVTHAAGMKPTESEPE